ncbi:MAG TPA: hypothetical protein VF897_13615 [Roseiflexaceae bacterium]
MTRANSGRSQAKLAQAQLLRELESTWRAWRAYIAEKKDEIAQRQADESGLDDLTVPLGGAANVRRARLSTAQRQELGAVLEQRRQAAQRDAEAAARQAGAPMPDVEQVMERLIQRISDELEGRVLASGYALIWFEGQLIEFDYRSIAAGTTDDDYLVVGALSPAQERRRKLIVGGVAGVVILAAAIVLITSLGGSSGAAAAAPATGFVAQNSTQLWDVQESQVGPVAAKIPGASLGYPILACLTEQQQQAARPNATVILTGTASVRSYTLHDTPGAEPRDLVVADCTKSPPKLLLSAALSRAETARTLTPSPIKDIAVIGPENDPANIPPDRMRVELLSSAGEAAQGTLVLPDGTRWSPSATEPISNGVRLSYLIPLRSDTQVAGWEIGGQSGLPELFSVTIPAPVGRAQLLRNSLAVSAAGADLSTRNGSQLLTLTLNVTLGEGNAPLALLPTDLVVKTTNGAAVQQVEWTPPALQPGKAATIKAVITLNNTSAPIEAALGNWRARLRW